MVISGGTIAFEGQVGSRPPPRRPDRAGGAGEVDAATEAVRRQGKDRVGQQPLMPAARSRAASARDIS